MRHISNKKILKLFVSGFFSVENFLYICIIIKTNNMFLSNSQIDWLKSKGFVMNDKHSKWPHIETENGAEVLIAYADGTYKYESYEILPDGDGGFCEDYTKEFSKPGQTLERFVELNFSIECEQ